MTGATGFLGIHLADMLADKGHTVIVPARSRNNMAPEERINALFRWLGRDRVPSCVQIVPADLNRSDLGLSPADYQRLGSRVDEIIHCASDTSFSERKRPQIEKANVENLHHLLDFAAKSRCCFFHFISTAYAAGKNQGICPETLVDTRSFFNVYEETKHRAEMAAADRCNREGIRLNIFRPSIVYGHSRTGRTLRFNALYYPVKILVFLKNLYLKKHREQDLESAEKMGISFTAGGTAHMPLRIEASPSGGINLIPVDFFTSAFYAIMENAVDGGIFHITNDKTKPVSDIIDYIRKYFHITGVQAVETQNYPAGPQNHLEILFNRYTEIYRQYMQDERIFDNARAVAILKPQGILCPDFDYSIFSTCMGYAESVNWENPL
ncbi:SDR family oxidoreductase [Desulfotignum phosphitoxidans]|nr:SDR family oxidoreductase [Desulfotignum phosphitoxidans]